MKIILLPGLDGTGKLFQPLLEKLPPDIDVLVINYPNNKLLNYTELVEYNAPHNSNHLKQLSYFKC